MSSVKPKKEYQITVTSPFPPHELFSVYNWIEDANAWDRVADDFTEHTRESFINRELAMMDLPNVQTWAVSYEGELGGYVTSITDPVRYWLSNCHCIFKKRYWGHRLTLPPLRQIAKKIFDSGILKIQMLPFEDNKAIRQLVKALGAAEEGILTAQTLRNGEPASMVMYGLYRTDLEKA